MLGVSALLRSSHWQLKRAQFAGFDRGCGPTTIHKKPNCYQLGFFLSKNSMVTRTYAICLLTISLSNLGIFARFWPNCPRFFSLFSVSLLTVQEAISNEINDLRGGGLQAEIGGRSRQRT